MTFQKKKKKKSVVVRKIKDTVTASVARCAETVLTTHHVGLPQRFTHAVHLLGAGAAHNKVLRHHGAANQIQGADEWLKGFGIQAGNDGLDVVGSEPGESTAVGSSG